VDLGAVFPGESNLSLYKANSSGQIVGYFGDDLRWSHAYSWTPDGGGVDLTPYLTGLRSDGWNLGARAVAVSEQGEVAGLFWTRNEPYFYNAHAFYWKAGMEKAIDLGDDPVGDPPFDEQPYGASSAPMDIDQGEIIGQCGGNRSYYGFTLAFAWSQLTGMIDIGDLGFHSGYQSGYALPTRVHDGAIVGFGMNATGANHAFKGSYAGITDIHRPEWATAGWLQSYASDVRNGQITGEVASNAFNRYHAMLWTEDGYVDLHPCNWKWSYGSGFGALDDSGAIVINGSDAQFNPLTGVYLPGGTPLAPPDVTVSTAQGQCSATVTYDLGMFGACLQATPASGSTFPEGTTAVQLTKEGLPAGSFNVTVQAPPPTISCPADIHLCTDGPVSFPAPVASGGCGQLAVACTSPSGSNFSSGATTDTCTATDGAGEQASCSFQVVRDPPAFDGFLPPIDGIGGSFAAPVRTFKLGSTVPVKFRELCGGAAVISGPAPQVTLVKWTDATDSTPSIDATPTDSATDGDQARLTGDQWHFNLSTAALSPGVWQVVVTLPGQGGAQRSVFVQLR
jgi:hypothetical protein